MQNFNHWSGKRVAFLGDSITDAIHVGTTKNYWQYLQEYLGIEYRVYGINGCQWKSIPDQAEKLFREHGNDTDAILVFMGTNDFNASVPPGEWWTLRHETVNRDGKILTLPRRIRSFNPDTFRGRINTGMEYLKTHFPQQQIILLTPVHRGFAKFSEDNVQPEDSFPNEIGLYVESYIEILREAGDIWSVPVIDLFRLSGLLPSCDPYAQYFHDSRTDRLHPNASGHARMARTLQYQLLSLPSDFKDTPESAEK